MELDFGFGVGVTFGMVMLSTPSVSFALVLSETTFSGNGSAL